MDANFSTFFFWVLTLVTLFSALMVVALHNLSRGVVCLILFFLGLAGLYFLLEAQFLALVEVMVYAGAVGVLFAFVVMLSPHLGSLATRQTLNQGWGFFLAALFLVFLLMALGALPLVKTLPPAGGGLSLGELGQVLLTDYLLPFELLSVVLLVALVGAVVLSARDPRRGSGHGPA